jgi:hypothetical protein
LDLNIKPIHREAISTWETIVTLLTPPSLFYTPELMRRPSITLSLYIAQIISFLFCDYLLCLGALLSHRIQDYRTAVMAGRTISRSVNAVRSDREREFPSLTTIKFSSNATVLVAYI